MAATFTSISTPLLAWKHSYGHALVDDGEQPQGAWRLGSSTAYQVNNVVTHGGNTTEQLQPQQITLNSSYWELLAGGYDFKGNWAATTAYKKDDAVVSWAKPTEPQPTLHLHQLCCGYSNWGATPLDQPWCLRSHGLLQR